MRSGQLCIICGSHAGTTEHIVPQALWKRFGLDPNSADLARYRTELCEAHQRATSTLHSRRNLLQLVDTGEPVTRKSLTDLADWAVWVTLLLGLCTGICALPVDESRDLLLRRFSGRTAGGLPAGIRVYAARIDAYVSGTDFVSRQIAIEKGDHVVLDHSNVPSGFTVRSGPVTATEAIGLGTFALLVVPRTYDSGPRHKERLDGVAASVGLDLIHPLPQPIPTLVPKKIDMRAVSGIFVPPGWGDDASLLPIAIQSLMHARASD
ncbi:hypothetical protein ACFVAV_11280 [Nocardia sp. NPDC057663]|uniref:hypothetical protein n=1 Tax=Nocardia sp. NPDC057663 TaxID=3346201 RepID=UPI00366A5559